LPFSRVNLALQVDSFLEKVNIIIENELIETYISDLKKPIRWQTKFWEDMIALNNN
jgi:hypothetical protein